MSTTTLPTPVVTSTIRLTKAPQTDDQLYWAIKGIWGVTIPRGRSTHPDCADHVPPFVAFADAYFERDSITDPDHPTDGSMALWHGSRGLSGKSFALSMLGIVKATFRGTDVNLLGGSFQQSKNISEHIRRANEFYRAPSFMVEQEGNELIRLSNKARIRPLTASQRSVRGPHPPFLILDEIDEMDLEILEGALGQPMPQDNYLGETLDPYTVMCSTWQNPDGTFTEILRRAEERGWPIYRWCYRCSANPEDGWLTEKHIERQKALISAEMWRVEYELGEPSIGNRAIDTDAVNAVFCLPFKPTKQKESKDFAEYTFEEPHAGGTYVVSADWGKEQDYTVIGVFRHFPQKKPRLVYYARMNRRPYPMMIRYFNDAIKAYRPLAQAAIHDRTGLGNVVADLIDSRATGFTFTGGKRVDMLSDYVAAVEGVKLQIPRIPVMYTEHKYVRTGDLYHGATKDYHLPDTIAMAGMAWRVLRRLQLRGGKGGAGEAVKGDKEPTKLERELEGKGRGRVGDVRQVSAETGEMNLTI